MGGATVAVIGGQVGSAGIYAFDLGNRKVYLDIQPKMCTITIK